MFGKKFKVIKRLPFGKIYMKIGGNASTYSEYFFAYESEGMLEYKIIDNDFGMPSLANTDDGSFAKHLRKLCSGYLEELIMLGFIELVD